MATQTGLVLNGSDGSVYFIRGEILEAAKVSADEMADTQRMIADSTETTGFAVDAFKVTQVEFANPNLKPIAIGGSDLASLADRVQAKTVMCCW